MPKNKFWIIGLVVGAMYLAFIANGFYQLITKSYYVEESNLCKIDTFHLRNRAYEQSTGSSSAHSQKSELIFESINKYKFSIDKEIFNAIIDKKKLEDTFMYHDTKFTVFSDTASYSRYKESKTPVFIRVYQLQIGDEKYINVQELNQYAKWNIKEPIILQMFFVPFFTLLTYKKNKEKSQRQKRKIIFWFICLPTTMLIITLLL